MPIGVIVNSTAVLLGGLCGAFLGNKIPERLRITLPLVFGVASMGIGINFIVKLKILPVVVLALVLGTAIGELVNLEKIIERIGNWARGPVEKLFSVTDNEASSSAEDKKEFMNKFIAIVILFCSSGTGVFGALTEGMTGDHTILLTKAILDFFTAAIFAAALGYLVFTIFVPQFIIFMILFLSANLIMPLTTPTMVADFTACGGMIALATGFRITGIKAFPTANMLPALLIVMPLSYLWVVFIH